MTESHSPSDSPSEQVTLTRPRLVLAIAVLGIWALTEVTALAFTVLANQVLTQPILSRQQAVTRHQAGLAAFISEPNPRAQFDSLLGWRYRASFARAGDTINSQGVRSSREYPTDPSGTRIAAYGDSFVYCIEVSNPDCWVSQLEARYDVEAMNYGVGGYGLDQAFLRYLQQGNQSGAQVVVVGFAPVDLRRMVNRYRGFISPLEGPWFKPRFLDSADGFVLLPPPARTVEEADRLLSSLEGIRTAGQHDQWYRSTLYENPLYLASPAFRLISDLWTRVYRRYVDPQRLYANGVFNTSSKAFELQVKLLQDFADSVKVRGQTPLVLMIPGAQDLRRVADGESATYSPLVEQLADRGVPVLDPAQVLESDEGFTRRLFAPGGHYSEEGNSRLADAVAEYFNLSSN